MQSTTFFHAIVPDAECRVDKSFAPWRLWVVLTGICCVAATASVGVALFCFGREQTTGVQLVELSNELRQIKVQMEALQSRCGLFGVMPSPDGDEQLRRTGEVVHDDLPSDAEHWSANDDKTDIEQHEVNDLAVMGRVRNRRQATARRSETATSEEKKKKKVTNASTSSSSIAGSNSGNNKNNSSNSNNSKSKNQSADIETFVHLQPDGEKTNLTLQDNRVMHGWKTAPWSKTSIRHALHNRQTLTIDKSGYYLVYAQIGYYTNADENGFSVVVEASPSGNRRQSRVLTRCMLGVDYVNSNLSPDDNKRFKTCHTSTVTYLSANERIQLFDESLADTVEFRPEPETHFWGVARMTTGSRRNS